MPVVVPGFSTESSSSSAASASGETATFEVDDQEIIRARRDPLRDLLDFLRELTDTKSFIL